jgi:plastocyanin
MLAGLAVLLSNAAVFAADAEVKIANFTFDPPTLTVPVGTTVTWTMATTSPM